MVMATDAFTEHPGTQEFAHITWEQMLENARAGDLVLTLGCGDIYKCAHMVMEAGA